MSVRIVFLVVVALQLFLLGLAYVYYSHVFVGPVDMLNSFPVNVQPRKIPHPRRLSTNQSDSYDCKESWMQKYANFHADSLKNTADQNSTTRFLVYWCYGGGRVCGGLGNRMSAISSLFWLAVLTNRVFLIHWGGPERLEDFLSPYMVNWNYDVKNLKRHKTYWSCCGKPAGYQSFRVDRPLAFWNWVDGVDFDALLYHEVEDIGTTWFFADHLWKNPRLQKRARDLGLPVPKPDFPFALIGCAMDFLFQKTSYLVQELEKARLHLGIRSRNPVIGIHIRTSDVHFGSTSLDTVHTHDIENVLKCTKRVEKLLKAKLNSSKSITWFLATDDVKVKSDWLRKQPMNVVTYNTTPSHLEITPGKTTMRDILMDLLLLSESDFFIPTWESTFSYVALGLRKFQTRNFIYGERCNVSSSSVELASAASGKTADQNSKAYSGLLSRLSSS